MDAKSTFQLTNRNLIVSSFKTDGPKSIFQARTSSTVLIPQINSTPIMDLVRVWIQIICVSIGHQKKTWEHSFHRSEQKDNAIGRSNDSFSFSNRVDPSLGLDARTIDGGTHGTRFPHRKHQEFVIFQSHTKLQNIPLNVWKLFDLETAYLS